MTAKYERSMPKDIGETYQAFFSVLKSNSLEELVTTAHWVFGLPLVLHDETSRLLYQCPQKPLGEKMWDIFLEEKTPGADVLQEYQRRMLADKPVDFEPFYYRPEDPEESSYILGQVYYRNRNYGYFTIFMFDAPLEQEDLTRAKIFSEALGFVMYHLNAANTMALNTSLYDALAGRSGEALCTQAVETLKKNTVGDYVMLAKPIGSSANQKTFATMALRQMRADLPVTIYQDTLVLLYGGIRSAEYRSAEREAIASIAEVLRPAGDACGVSARFCGLKDLEGYFQQARMTVLCARDHLAFYEEVTPAPVFQFAAQYGRAEAFLAPVLSEIHRYDAQNKTEYFLTLRAYSLFLHNKERTAAELCIHRNTLLYRLNRLEELFGVPFEDPQTALHLLNSFQLWDIINAR